MSDWAFVVALGIGALAGALVTAVWFLDHKPGEKKRRWWEDE